ncbi:MAG: hypothetical protein GF330_11010 [Candidatus Eisenbacteria bacterium]|nr:hypothetical protein [Candidatus Eisenbacteria bacterium]
MHLKPQGVIALWSQAMQEKDTELLDALLAREFTQQHHGCPAPEQNAREEWLEATRVLLESPRIEDLRFWLGGDFEVIPGQSVGTWVLDGIRMRLSFDRFRTDGDLRRVELEKTLRWLVRQEHHPEPHFVLSRWEDWDTTER